MMTDLIRLKLIRAEMVERNFPADLMYDINKVIMGLEQHNKWLLPDWETLDKPIMTIDFDGCIADYKTGWVGVDKIPDPPVPGAFDFLSDAVNYFHVLIFSSRCNADEGIKAMKDWFIEHNLSHKTLLQLTFQPGKPSAHVMIDDRAIQFRGRWDFHLPKHLKELFTPWYYGIHGYRKQQVGVKGEL